MAGTNGVGSQRSGSMESATKKTANHSWTGVEKKRTANPRGAKGKPAAGGGREGRATMRRTSKRALRQSGGLTNFSMRKTQKKRPTSALKSDLGGGFGGWVKKSSADGKEERSP